MAVGDVRNIRLQFSDQGERFDTLASDTDIFECFRLLLGRFPSEREFQEHCWRVGQPLDLVVASILNSPEFSSRGLLEAKDFGAAVKQLDGYTMYVTPSDMVIGRTIWETGDYETNVSQVFRKMVMPGMGVLDIGANIGFYAMLSCSLVGSTGKVWALEPSPRNVAFLLASKNLNGFDQLEVVQAAASFRWEVLSYFEDSTNGITGKNAGSSNPADYRETVQALPGSAIIPQGERVDVIKIDIEGFEGKAILGIHDLLAQQRPVVFSEFSPESMPERSEMKAEEYLELFYALNYHLTALLESGQVNCGDDPARLMGLFESAKSNHIDILATPAS